MFCMCVCVVYVVYAMADGKRDLANDQIFAIYLNYMLFFLFALSLSLFFLLLCVLCSNKIYFIEYFQRSLMNPIKIIEFI